MVNPNLANSYTFRLYQKATELVKFGAYYPMSSYMWVYPKGDKQLFRTLNVLSPSVPTSWEYIVAYLIDQGGGTIWRSNTLQVLKTTKTFTLDNQV